MVASLTRCTLLSIVIPACDEEGNVGFTVRLPLKAIVRGYTWTTTPISWRNRKTGIAKLKIREMGSRYLFIILYVWLENFFSRGDYRRQGGGK